MCRSRVGLAMQWRVPHAPATVVLEVQVTLNLVAEPLDTVAVRQGIEVAAAVCPTERINLALDWWLGPD